MKVIDLLNKIANGGEIPNKIKYDNMIYELEYSEFGKEYISNDESDGIILVLDIDIDHLNDEVEIIEEPQKHKTQQLVIFEDGEIYDTRLAINSERRMINQILLRLEKMEDLLEKIENNK